MTFPPMPVSKHPQELYLTLVDLPSTADLTTSHARVVIDVAPNETRTLELALRPPQSVWVASLGRVKRSLPHQVTLRLEADDPSLKIHVREIALADVAR